MIKPVCLYTKIVSLTFILMLLFDRPAQSQNIVLIDFGSNQTENIFELQDWNQILISNNMVYSSEGPGGIHAGSDLDEFTDFMGVQGTSRPFSVGERIVVTWYNNSDEPISFTSRISFTDEDEPSGGTVEGNWYTMRNYEDYRYTYSEIQPHATAQTVFNITDTGIHKTDETYALVNINLNIEWFETYQKQFLICDKIELYNDADITAPDQTTGLSATVLSNAQIRLDWDPTNDNVETVEYLVYLNGAYEGYSRTNSYTVHYLQPISDYTFTVSALDMVRNEGVQSEPVTATSMALQSGSSLFNPLDFRYLGAVRLPETFAYGGEALAYNPNGDGGPTGAGADDGYPGSFYTSDLNQPQRGFVGELSVPAPALSPDKNLDELNEAVILQDPVDIRPANVNSWDYVDVWYTGLEYVAEENRLYSSWAIYYEVTGDKTASVSCIDASDLAGSTPYGAWFVGSSSNAVLPTDPYLNDYLFQAPQEWADNYLDGRALINGRYREGGLSGLGPTLYAVSLVGTETPPQVDTELDLSRLLEYGPVEASDNYNFPDAIDDYNHADWWRDADWMAVDGQNAVMIIGNKALGDNWYGYQGEQMHHDWLIADVPYPDAYWDTDPDGKGWQSHNMVPMAVFYDPNELAAVVDGSLAPYEPQPYAAVRFDKSIFWGPDAEIRSATYDHDHQVLYVTEYISVMDGTLLVHAWKVNEVVVESTAYETPPDAFTLEQNYPNPFNPATTIGFTVPEISHVTINLYNLLGQKTGVLTSGIRQAGKHTVTFSADRTVSHLPSGLYVYEIIAVSLDGSNTYRATGKMVLQK